MKKYVKPELYFESFELSQQIAACDFLSNNTATDENCIFTGDHDFWGANTKLFISPTPCDVQPEVYCYHNDVASGIILFNS